MDVIRDSLHYDSAKVNAWEQTDGQVGIKEGRKEGKKERKKRRRKKHRKKLEKMRNTVIEEYRERNDEEI